jgi:hypothetical protein
MTPEQLEQILALLKESERQLRSVPERVLAMHNEVEALPEAEREDALLARRVEITRTINEPWFHAGELMNKLDQAEVNRNERIGAAMHRVWSFSPRPEGLIWGTRGDTLSADVSAGDELVSPAWSERQRRGQTAVRDEGGYLGGPVPFGLRLDEFGQWQRSEDEAWVLRQLAARRVLGATFAELADWLNDPHRPMYQPSPAGKRWTAAIVHRILTNPIYHRTDNDVPAHLDGLRRIRAEHNYRTCGILAEPITPAELERNAPFVTHDDHA